MANTVFPRNVYPHVQQGLGIWTKVKFYYNICGRIVIARLQKSMHRELDVLKNTGACAGI
jgi:hypothetical protein